MRKSLIVVLLAASGIAGNRADHWVWFDSRESEDGPRLVVQGPGGEPRTLRAGADTVVISYLADRAWGGHRQLSVTLGDTTRVLLAFDANPGEVAKAELVLRLHPSQLAPREPFELGVHRVAAAWSERETTWTNQPAFDAEPVAAAEVGPGEGEVRIDVTGALRKGVPHGFLLKVTQPLEAPPPADAGAYLKDVLAWAPDVATAKERAAKERKLVLALVRGSFGGDALAWAEETLLATALAHPDVNALVADRFVPVRVAYEPFLYAFAAEDPKARKDPRDPLPALGTSVHETKVPALVVATAKGGHVATLQSIGTYDWGLVHAFLTGALPRGGEKGARGHLLRGDPEKALAAAEDATVEGVALLRLGRFDEAERTLARAPGDEAAYWRGALLWRRGEREGAKEAFRAIAAESPWHAKARARLLWPERLGMYECLEQPAYVTGGTETKGGAGAVERAAAYLVATQRPDGAWVNAQHYPDTYAAVTALCARALLAHGQGADAVQRATVWLAAYLETTDPADANAWSACYTLDFFCDLLARDGAHRETAQRAVRFVEGGQGPGGAWSYGRTWGMSWKGGFGGWPKTDRGRYHSMNTGPSLVSLLRARDLGLAVDTDVLARGRDALLKMRDGPGVFTYTWPEPRNFNEPRASISRGPVCELALVRLEAARPKDLDQALKTFMEWREGLRGTVKLTAGWTPPSLSSAYFYFFAYHHAAEALDFRGKKKDRETLRRDLLDCVEADGTWVDYEPNGKPYATAMALLVLR